MVLLFVGGRGRAPSLQSLAAETTIAMGSFSEERRKAAPFLPRGITAPTNFGSSKKYQPDIWTDEVERYFHVPD
jgi:hypothetical protein